MGLVVMLLVAILVPMPVVVCGWIVMVVLPVEPTMKSRPNRDRPDEHRRDTVGIVPIKAELVPVPRQVVVNKHTTEHYRQAPEDIHRQVNHQTEEGMRGMMVFCPEHEEKLQNVARQLHLREVDD